MSPDSPPDGLAASGTLLWTSVTEAFDLDVHERLLLVQACRCADRLDALAVDAGSAPLTSINSKGDLVTHPSLVESRQQSITLSRLLASLRMPSGESTGRPQRRGASRGTYNTLRSVL